MRKFTLAALSTAICALSISASVVTPSFAQSTTTPTDSKAAPAKTNTQSQLIEQLKLSEDQQMKLAKLEQTVSKKAIGLLTVDQKEQIKLAMQQGKAPNLKLTSEQQMQLKAIQTAALSQRDAILTTEQKQKLQQLRKQYTRQS
jgi:periplasmic protein CpxP/Spy